VYDKWKQENWERGRFGWPLSDTESPNPNTLKNKFQGGTITWNSPGSYKLDTPYTHVRFVIDKVQCSRQTSDGSARDEIWVTGVAYDNNMKAYNVKPIEIGKFKKNQEIVKRWIFCTLPIGGPGWPKGGFISLVLVEEDTGNITGNTSDTAKLQNSIHNVVKSEVISKAPEAGAALGTLILPGIGTAIGYLAGTAIVGLLKDVVDKLFGSAHDDILGVATRTVTVRNIHDNISSSVMINIWQDKKNEKYDYYIFGHWEFAKL